MRKDLPQRTRRYHRVHREGAPTESGPMLVAREVGGAEVEVSVEFALEEGGAALGVADVFGGVATDAELDGYGAALERGAEILNALAVGVIEAFGDAEDGGEATRDALVIVVEGGVAGVIGVGRGFAIVIANDGGDNVAVAAFEAGDVTVKGQIFAVLVVAAMSDAMADVVNERAGFELDAGLSREMMQRLEMIEEHDAEFTDVLGVALVVFKAAGEAARADEHLPRFGGVTVRLLAGESFAGNLLDDAFPDADGGNEKLANVEIAAEDDEDDGGDAHDIGAVAADAVGFHAFAEIAFKDVGQAFAQKRNIERGEAFAARAGSDVRKCFGVSAEGDRELVGEIRAMGKARLEQGPDVAADLLRLDGTNGAGNAERGHEANGADGKLGALQDGVVAQNVDFQAAAAKIDDAVRRSFRAKSGDGGFPAEARFFFCGDDFEAEASRFFDSVDESAAVAGFAGSAGGDGAIFGDAVFLHDFVKVAKGFDGFLEKIFAEAMADENAFAEAQREAFVDERFDIERGKGADDGQADGVGAGVDGGDMDRLGHGSVTARDSRGRKRASIWRRGCRVVRRCAGATAC